MTKLFIIGNGFDLWHGLPTSFGYFTSFARELLDEIEQFFSFPRSDDGLWSDFEKSLGRFNSHEFFDVHNHVDVMSEDFRPRDVFCLEDYLVERTDEHVEAIREKFTEWVEEIDVHAATIRLRFPADARFFTFNYTSTLQTVYGVSDDRVFHVHGYVDMYDELIFGHGEPPLWRRLNWIRTVTAIVRRSQTQNQLLGILLKRSENQCRKRSREVVLSSNLFGASTKLR